MSVAYRFYRATRSNPPTLRDVSSNEALGIPQADSESDEDYRAISTYTKARKCAQQAQRFGLGGYIAELTIPGDGPIMIGHRSKNGHCNLIGPPEDLLATVGLTVTVGKALEG